MSLSDHGYTNLLAHLHRPTTTLALSAIQAVLAHHLAHLSPLPTPLAAIAVSSPLFISHPPNHSKLQALSTAFRHSTHIKFRAITSPQSGLRTFFARSLGTRVRQWVEAVSKGIQGGQPIIRLACCSGLLMGLEDLKVTEKLEVGGRGGVEEEVVVALAEVMDTHAYAYGFGRHSPDAEGWEKEFQLVKEDEVDVLSLALILASQSLPLVAPEKLKALPLRVLARLLMLAISSAFQSGTFLSTLSSSTAPALSYKIQISSTSPLAQTLQRISSSPLTPYIAPLSKLTAMTLSLLLDFRPLDGLSAVAEALGMLEDIAEKIECDWKDSELARMEGEHGISPDTREITKLIWTTLKTVLFSTIMISDAALSTVIYVPPVLSPSPLSSAIPVVPTPTPVLSQSALAPTPTPHSLALTTLYALSRLAFVISQFGGVTTTSQGFSELKKTFYLALDILAQSGEESDKFVRQLCSFGNELGGDTHSHGHAFRQAKKAYTLASIEQLVPILSGECLQLHAFPLCLPHLFDPAHREAYESAHSVVLAIFASHAQRVGEGNFKAPTFTIASFAERMVPFYAHCLIENSFDGKLSTAQLRLAYSALVRSASATSVTSATLMDERYTLAEYCIQELLGTIRSLGLGVRENEGRLYRLHLTLISTVPSLPLRLLPRTLEEIRRIVMAYPVATEGRRRELVDALFVEILERVGDREKEFTLRWWHDNRTKLFTGDSNTVAEGGQRGVASEDNQSRSGILSRL